MASKSFTWDPSEMKASLNTFDARIDALVAVVVDYSADKATRYMKTNAPWTDRTGNARQTLQARAQHKPFEHVIRMFGGMPYQIWLEIRWGGRYSIIAKSIKPVGANTMKLLKGLFDRLKAGV